MRIALIILGIWLLINVLFVVLMSPPRRPRKQHNQRPTDSGPAPVLISKEAYPFDAEEKTSLQFTIISVAMVVLFSLSPLIVEAVDSIKRIFRKRPPAK